MSKTSAFTRISDAVRPPRPPCTICGRPGLVAPISLGKSGSPPHCSSSCLETIRHNAIRAARA